MKKMILISILMLLQIPAYAQIASSGSMACARVKEAVLGNGFKATPWSGSCTYRTDDGKNYYLSGERGNSTVLCQKEILNNQTCQRTDGPGKGLTVTIRNKQLIFN